MLIVADVTTLERSMAVVAGALGEGIPAALVVTMMDEHLARGGTVDLLALERAIGVPVRGVVSTDRDTKRILGELLDDIDNWAQPPFAPPSENVAERRAWISSVLAAADYTAASAHGVSRAVDRVLLHPVAGSLVFFAVMFLFFQTIFTVAAPAQDAIDTFFGWLGGLAADTITHPVLADFVASGLIGGVGSVLVFVPQILLLFLLIALLESVGYMSRAAFLMDRLMGMAGLEGRAFVAMLSSFACAVPGIMATRTIPSARDRIATILSAPLMTCSARLPVYVLLVGMLVPAEATWGPFGAQGAVMFGLYFLGGISALIAALIMKKTVLRSDSLPFFMEMPPYRLPTWRSVLTQMWDSTKAFLQKVGKIILLVTIVLWVLLSLPVNTEQASLAGERAAAAAAAQGESPADVAAIAESAEKSYQMEHSIAGMIGRGMEPIFAPQEFDWHINIGILGSLAAREVYVATMGQIAAAEDPEDPVGALETMTRTTGDKVGQPVFTAPVTAAILIFFVYALQCVSTIAAMRRETNSWRWPALAWAYMFTLAWVGSAMAHTVVAALTS